MKDLTPDQKLMALNALTDVRIQVYPPVRHTANWHAETYTPETRGILTSTYGDSNSLYGAIEDLWEKVTAPGVIVVTSAWTKAGRQEHTWNGFMWKKVN